MGKRRRARWRLAKAGCLLEGVGVCQQSVLRIVEPEQFAAHRDAKRRGGTRRGEPGREGDRREPGAVGNRAMLFGITPLRLTRPRVGRMPTRLLADAGERIDWPVSLPVPRRAKLAATAAPVPPLDPPGVRVRSYGFSA